MKNEIIKAEQVTIDFLLEAKDNNAPATLVEFAVPPGAKIPVTYYHEHFDETIYGLERFITFTVEAKAIDIAPGETHFIPCDAVYGFDGLNKIDLAKKLFS